MPEDVEAAISERAWDLIRIYSETIRQDIRARVLCEPARAFDIINTANLTDSLIPAQTRELRHIARLLDALLTQPKGRDHAMNELIALAAHELGGETAPTANARDFLPFLA